MTQNNNPNNNQNNQSFDKIHFTGFNPFDFTTYIPAYGNFAGPSWSGGKRVSGKLEDESFDRNQIAWVNLNGENKRSQIDTAAFDHDLAYNNSMGAEDEAYQVLKADVQLLKDVANADWSLMTASEKTYASLLVPAFTLKIAAIDTPTSAFETLKNEAKEISSEIFAKQEFKQEFQVSNPYTDGFGNSASGGFDQNGNILLNFSKNLSEGSASSSSKTLNATFLGKDISSIFDTDLDVSLQNLSLTTSDTIENSITSNVNLVKSDKIENLLTKYSLNPNISDYSNSIPTLIINDGNGNNFNLAALPDFSYLSEAEQITAFDQFTTNFLDTALADLNIDLTNFEQFLNDNQVSYHDFSDEISSSLNLDNYQFSDSFDRYFSNNLLNNLNLDSNLFEVSTTINNGFLRTEYQINPNDLSINHNNSEPTQISSTQYFDLELDDTSLDDYLSDAGYINIEYLDDYLSFDFNNLYEIFGNQLENDQQDLIDRLSEDLDEYLSLNPTANQNEILDYLKKYDEEWQSISDSLVYDLEVQISNLIDEYQSYKFYDPETLDCYFDANLRDDIELPYDSDWRFDWSEYDGENLWGYGYYRYQEDTAFDYAGSDYESYWSMLDNDGDEVINYYTEYDEDIDQFEDWFLYSSNLEDEIYDSFDDVHNIRFYDIWVEGYEEIYAFEIRDMGEYDDYWDNFDSNGDGYIDEYEYYEDGDFFFDWWYNSWIWESPGDAYEYAHNVNFDYHYIETEFEIRGFDLYETEYSSYWEDFDENYDGIIDEDEYFEDELAFEDWFFDHEYYEILESRFYDALDEFNLNTGSYRFVEDEYEMSEYWDILISGSFEEINYDFSQLAIDNFNLKESFNIDFSNSWQPSEISYNINLLNNFDFEIDDILLEFEDFLYNLNYQQRLNFDTSVIDQITQIQYNVVSDLSIYSKPDSNDLISLIGYNQIIKSGRGDDIINIIGSGNDISTSEGNDILISSNGNNIFRGESGDDIYIFNSDNISNDEIIDDDGLIIIDNKVFSGIANQYGYTNNYKIGEYLISEEGEDLKVFYKSSIFVIKDFTNGKYGIELNNNPETNSGEVSLQEDQEIVINLIDQTNDLEEDDLSFKYFHNSQNADIFEMEKGIFKYIPKRNFNGYDYLEILITDQKGGYLKKEIEINIQSANDVPINSGEIQNQRINIGELFSYELPDNLFIDVEDQNLTITAKIDDGSIEGSLLPSWLSFDGKKFSGIADESVINNKLLFSYLFITITATDSSGASLSDDFRLTITRNLMDDFKPKTEVLQITGSDSDDEINATENSTDIIYAGEGDDVINFVKDADWQQINDVYFTAWNVYTDDQITVTGKQRSYDAFDGGDGYDSLNLTDQNDVIFLDDTIVSNVGDIAKLASIEEISAGDGDDVVDLTSLTFSYDDVVLNGGNGDDVLWGNDGDDTINGDEGEDNLQGGKGDDTINGGSGNDTIKGYDGDDLIIGGEGFDVMTGGDGADQFIFTDKTDSTGSFSNLSETDIISDFIQNEDKIDLSTLDFDSITQGQGSNASANGLEFYFEDGYTIIDDPNSNFAVKLAGEIQLAASDFNF
jgi:Ca2+-binding RTX toxin-like protein